MAKGKAEIVAEVAAVTGYSAVNIAEALDAIVAVITDTLRNNGEIQIRGFGTLSIKKTEARMGRNPRTGVEVPIAAGRRAHFKPSKSLLAD